MYGKNSILILFKIFMIIIKKDVLLPADTFEKFISTNIKYYNLDSCHYFSAPGLSMTKVDLEKSVMLICIFLLKKNERRY